ncbi:MAG: septation protein IspZ [Pseudomonadota bacterium]
MDRRLWLELLPGVVFVAVNWIGGLFAATAAAVMAGLVAMAIRWWMDRTVPWLAVATMALTVILLVVGIVMEDESYVKIRPTVGGVAFAAFVLLGGAFRPTLLERSLDYKLDLTAEGWQALHLAWAAITLAFAGLNEVVWRTTSTEVWVAYSAISGWATFGVVYGATYWIAWWYWDE